MKTWRAVPVFLALCFTGTAVMADDAKNFPPPLRQFQSTSGHYHLSIRLIPGTRNRRASAELEREGRTAWSRELPQVSGPAFALIADSGETILFDEWIHVMSPMAVMVLDPKGQVVRQWSFQDIASALGLSVNEIIPKARFGPWITKPPFPGPTGFVRVETGGKTLRINVVDGTLTVE